MAAGGAGIGNLDDGTIVFIEDATPGDIVDVEITKRHKRHAEGRAAAVVEPGSWRRAVPCPHAAADPSCGGCDWQHIEPDAAAELRRSIVIDSLRRIGKLDDVDVRTGPSLPATAYRTTVRAAVHNGRPGFRARGSHDVVVIDECQTAHPVAADVLTTQRFDGADEIIVKVGARTGDRMIIVDGVADVPFIHEEIAGHRFRISAGSFFQCRPDGAEVLVRLAGEAIAGADPTGTLIDAYAGVGLFSALLAGGRPVLAIESNPSSTADAGHNLAHLESTGLEIVTGRVERWTPSPAAAVLADPARSGLGKDGVGVIVATGATHIALVSCDPASLGRDARLLVDSGYELQHVTTVDLFGNTSHIEAVSAFTKR